MPLPGHQKRREPPASWIVDPTRNVPMGSELPQANYCKYGDEFETGSGFPSPILPGDYTSAGGPVGFFPLEALVVKAASKVEETMESYMRYGVGVEYSPNGTRHTVWSWADRISNDWYGKDYWKLTDWDKRNSIRCAMMQSNQSAAQLMWTTALEEIITMSSARSIGYGTATAVLAGFAAAGCIPCGVVGAALGVASFVIGEASKVIAQNVVDLISGGGDVADTQVQQMCATINTILDTGDAIWDASRGVLEAVGGDQDFRSSLATINNQIIAIREQVGEILDIACGTIIAAMDEAEEAEDTPATTTPWTPPPGPSAVDLQCQAYASRQNWRYSHAARYYGNGIPWRAGTTGAWCGINIKENRRSAPWADVVRTGNGNGADLGGWLQESMFGGIPNWAALLGGWLVLRRR